MSKFLPLVLIVFIFIAFFDPQNIFASDGTIDTSFVTGTGFDGSVNTLARQSDGKIIVGGQFYNYNGTPSASIIRLNTDGSIDNSFTIGTGFNGAVTALGVESNGKIVVAGTFDDYNSNYSKGVVRLNSDGTFDPTFVTGTGISGARNFYSMNAITIQSDDKIILGGRFNGYNGNTVANIVRINTDGSFDSSFLQGSGFDNEVFSFAIQPDTKIIVGGTFNDYDGNTIANIIRLNSDGTFDSSFSTGAGLNDRVMSIGVQSDNKIILAGHFTTYDGNTTPYLVRLNSNGSIDGSFNTSSNFDSIINSMAVQSNGKIIVVGVFNNYGSTAVSHGIAQLSSNGSLDSTFTIGTGFDTTPIVSILDSNNKLIVGGDFGQFNGSTAVNLIRLNADPVVVVTPSSGGHHRSTGFLPGFVVQIPVAPPVSVSVSTTCVPLINSQIERGKKNNPEEVNKLVTFLNTHEGTKLLLDGIYGRQDFQAIKNFQTKYYKDIFSPFSKKKVTGIVGYYTRFKINELNCLKTN